MCFLGVAPKKSKAEAKLLKGTKASKAQMAAMKPAPASLPTILEASPEDEMALDMMLGLRKKREVEDETEAADDVAAKSAAILADMATVKQSILVQLDAMNKAESAASKAVKLAAKANKKASTLATLLGVPAPTSPPVPAAPVADFQQKIAALTNIYSQLSDAHKKLTSAPDAADPLNPDKLFIAAINAKVNKILMKNALLTTATAAPKVARSNSWQRYRGQQDNDAAQQVSRARSLTSFPLKCSWVE